MSTSKGNLINDSANSIQVSNPHQNSKKIIIITNSTQNKDNQQTSKLTYEEGPYSIQCEVGKPSNQMNKKVIDNTVKILQETIKKKGRNGASELSSHHSDIKHSSVQPSDKPAISQSSSSEDNDVIENSISHNIPNHIVMTTMNNDVNIATTNNELNTDNETTQVNTVKKIPYLNTNASNTNHVSSIPTMVILNSSYTPSHNIVSSLNDTNYNSCIICDKIYPVNNLYSAQECKHLLCRKCIKNYYEEKIEEGEKSFKCPIFKCPSVFAQSMIKAFVSAEHFNLVNGRASGVIDMKLTLASLNKKYDTIKKYTMHHVIDINSNEDFYVYNKAKIQFCPKCGEQALFGKSGTHFVKCLNCNYSLCKYCMKEYDEKHMDITTENHCKVFFRTNDGVIQETQSHIGINLLIQFLLVLCSYIFMFVAGFLYIKEGVEWVIPCGMKSALRIMFVLVVSIILFLIAIPIILMSFPYFPVFIAIFN